MSAELLDTLGNSRLMTSSMEISPHFSGGEKCGPGVCAVESIPTEQTPSS